MVPGDRGRPLRDLVSRLDGREIGRDIHEVLSRQQAIERRVSANGGTGTISCAFVPYRVNETPRRRLITFTNVTGSSAEEHQKALAAELSHRVKNTLTVVASIASQTGARAPSLEASWTRFLGRVHGWPPLMIFSPKPIGRRPRCVDCSSASWPLISTSAARG